MRRKSVRIKACLVSALLGLAGPLLPLQGAELRSWEFRFTAGQAYESNIFLEMGESRPDWITSLGGQAQAEIRLRKGLTLVPLVGLQLYRYNRYSVATYPQMTGGLELRSGMHRLEVEYSSAWGRLLYISAGPRNIIYESGILSAVYRARISSPLTLSFGYEREREDYGLTAPGRNMTANIWLAEVRYRVNASVTPRLGVSWGRENARDVEYTFDRPEVMAAASVSRPSGLNLFVRYRLTWRKYITPVTTGRNFARRDHHHNFLFELRIPVMEDVFLVLRENYKKKISTRPDTNFTDNVIAAEVVFVF
jgi:hypothetical protein